MAMFEDEAAAAAAPRRGLSDAQLMRATPARIGRGELPAAFVSLKITHLNLQASGLKTIVRSSRPSPAGADGQGLGASRGPRGRRRLPEVNRERRPRRVRAPQAGVERCQNLRVLYVYDNELEELEEACLVRTPLLTHIFAQGNRLARLPTAALPSLRSLRKLFLDRNCLSHIAGLEGCVQLEELSVAHQQLEPGESLSFDDASITTLSRSLRTLNVAGNQMQSLRSLARLRRLQELDLRDNAVDDFSEVIPLLSSLVDLRRVDFRGNPVVVIEPKFHNKAVVVSSSTLRALPSMWQGRTWVFG